jgi:hypothetical protein
MLSGGKTYYENLVTRLEGSFIECILNVMKVDVYKPYSVIGWFLIILGIIFVTIPYLTRVIPNFERVPWFIIYVYKKDGFFFATSPLLILLSIVSIFLSYWNRT